VIDWNRIRDNNTLTDTSQAPTGIAAVFINGRQVMSQGRVNGAIKVGKTLPV